MKSFIYVILAWLAFTVSANGAATSNSVGQHGMALFGNSDTLYASHLPMFHAPHDYQVVLQIHLADPVQDKMLRARLNGTATLWTLSPEKFELNRLAPHSVAPLKQFKSDVVLGHFEQGGTTQLTAAAVVVDKVLIFRHLSPKLKKSENAHYRQIGSGAHRFLVKEIDSRPDFDHIVAIATKSTSPTKALKVNKIAVNEPAAQALASAMKPAHMRIIGTVYFCTDDLL